MSSQVVIDGVVPVIPTAFHSDESVDDESFVAAVDFVASRRLAGMCLPAYGSEYYKLSDAERQRLVERACDRAAGRVPVIAQANHPSELLAAELAKRYETIGADAISFAVPRQFAVGVNDLMRYCGRICEATNLPVLLQDFNPGGPTVDARFISTLHRSHPNLQYVKLEDPLAMTKIQEIIAATDGNVGVLSGWGGHFLLETLPAGICGIMPGVPISDLLNRVFQLRKHGQANSAYDLFGKLLPYIAFTLHNFELFLQTEKRLLVRRAIFATSVCRSLTWTPDENIAAHIDFLLDQIMRLLVDQGLEN